MSSADANIARKPKLSLIPRGHWRNKYTSELPVIRGCEKTGAYTDTVGPGEFFSLEPYISAEVAEQRAVENVIKCAAGIARKRIRYLGPVFFPVGPA